MDYKKIYKAIIDNSKERSLAGYSEKHHIIPRCMGGTNDKHNIAILTAREHYICHQLLVKMYPENKKLLSAAMFMTGGNKNRKFTNRVYSWLREQWSQHMKDNNPAKTNSKKGKDHHFYGKSTKGFITKEGKKKLSNKMLGEKNPCSGVKPWRHPRATEYTKSIWVSSHELYDIWIANNKPSYNRLYRLHKNNVIGNNKGLISPYMNIIKYFKNNWIPRNDPDWVEFNLDHKKRKII